MKRIHKRVYLIAIFVILVLFMSNFIQYSFFRSILIDNTKEITKLYSYRMAKFIDNWLIEKGNVILKAADRLEHFNLRDEEILEYLKGAMEEYKSYSSIYYGTKDNKMINASGWIPPEDFDLTIRPWYVKAVEEDGLIFTEPFLNASKDDIIITVAAPIKDYKGEIKGVVGGDISLKTIANTIEKDKIGENGFSVLIDGDGNILAHPAINSTVNFQDIEDIQGYKEIFHEMTKNKVGFKDINIDNQPGFFSYLPINNTNWILGTFIPKLEFTKSISQFTLTFVLTSFVSVIIFLAFLWYNDRFVLRPIVKLKRFINNIREEDDLSIRLTKIESNYFFDFVKTFNTLLDRLEFQNSKFMALFRNAIDAIVFLDGDHRIIDVNDRFTQLFGYELEEVKGKDLDDIISSDLNYNSLKELTMEVQKGKSVEEEGIRYSKDGRAIHVNIKGVPFTYKGKVVGIYGIYSDITEKKKHEKTLKYLSMHDALTGLYNRAYFEECLIAYDSKENLPLSLIIGDINGLKLTNDAFGHKEGDNLLLKISQVFRGVCRKDDIICRIGGDEFAILMPNTDEKTGNYICSKILEACSQEENVPVPLSISLGICTKVNVNQDINEIFNEAENRMYRNKLLNSKSSRSAIIDSLFKTLKEKTFETEEHCRRLENLSAKVGQALGMSSSEIDELRLLGKLHDIGKVAIPNEILLKKDKLTDEEWEILKKHPEIGNRIALTTPEMASIAEKILCHHERWDGTGYPQGLKGEEIPIESRILSIVDSYDVMTNERPYRAPISHEEAIEEIKRCAGKQFDPNLVKIFVEIINEELENRE